MKKRIIVITAIVVLTVAFLGFIFLRKPKEQTPILPEPSTTVEEDVQKQDPPQQSMAPVLTDPSSRLTRIMPAEPNMELYSGYHTETLNGQLMTEIGIRDYNTFCNDAHRVEGVTTFNGSPVYYASKEELLEYYSNRDDMTGVEGGYFYFSGTKRMASSSRGYVFNINDLREEGTGNRIYVLPGEEYVVAYQNAWEIGQAILSGEQEAEVGTLIVNGRYLDNYVWREVDDTIQIPLLGVGEAVDVNSFRVDDEKLIIYLPVRHYTGNSFVKVPRTMGYAPSSILTFETGKLTDQDGWTDEFHYAVDALYWAPVDEVIRYTGWKAYTDGIVLHIISDPPDVTNNFITDTREPLSPQEQFELYGEYSWEEELDDPNMIDLYEQTPQEENTSEEVTP